MRTGTLKTRRHPEQKKRLTESVKQANGMNNELLAQKTKLDEEVIRRS